MKNKNYLFVAAILSIALVTVPAHSALIYVLDQNNAGLPDGDLVRVTISDGADGNIDFTVEVLTAAFPNPGGNFGMDKFFFNAFPTVAPENITGLDDEGWKIKENKNVAEFGRYDFRLHGPGARTELLTFSISGIDGDFPVDYALGSPQFFAAHVGGFLDPGSGAESAQIAGNTLVPIPGAVWLLGSGLIGLVFLRRKKLVK